MFISLFGIELFMQMGLMKYLKPIVLPLLGFHLCMIYIAAFWLTGILKHGAAICALTTGFSMLARVLILIWVLIFF